MFDLITRRRRSSHRRTSTVSQWINRLETLESRVVLSNGLVGVAAEFLPSASNPHLVSITSVPEDPGNTGVVSTTTVTAIGLIQNPKGGAISDFHTTLIIDAFESGTNIGTVSWDAGAGPGTTTGAKYMGQDPAHVNQALFSLPFTLLSAASGTQNVTFTITAVGYGTRNVVLVADTAAKLTGTFEVVDAAPTVGSISQPATPRNTAVASVDVTFSKPIDPATFTVADLGLTLGGTTVPLGAEVTFNTTDNTTFTVGGLATDTAASGAYVLTVNAAGVATPLGTPGAGSQAVNFVVDTVQPTVSSVVTPAPSTSAISSVDVVFSEAINPATFTTADLTLSIDATGVPQSTPLPTVPLGPEVQITTSDNITFHITGLQTATAAIGGYSLAVDATGVQDFAGNSGKNPGVTPTPVKGLFSHLPGNGVVGIAAMFKSSATTSSPHQIVVTGIPEDSNNDGVINTQTITFNGFVERLDQGVFTDTHLQLYINAYQNDPITSNPTLVGSVFWNADVNTGGSLTGSPALGQDPNLPYRANFSIPVLLLSSSSTPQDVTFQVFVVQKSATPRDFLYKYATQPTPASLTGPKLTAHFTIDTGAPTVSAISPITTPRNTPVATVDVTFSEAIDPTTFTTADLALTRGGSPVPLSPGVAITTTDNVVFQITGLSGDTAPAGSYQLTVDATGVKDIAGNAGTGSQSASFVVDTSTPAITAVSAVTTPRNTPVPSVDVTFAEVINPSTFTTANITLTRGGSPVTLSPSVQISTSDNQVFHVTGLTTDTTAAGSYVFTASAVGVLDPAGNSGSGSLGVSFVVDTVGPTILPLAPIPKSEDPIASIDVTFSEVIDPTTFTKANLALTRGGVAVTPLTDVTITTTDNKTFHVNGLTTYTTTPATYRFTANTTGVKDLAGNSGTGNQRVDFIIAPGPWVEAIVAPAPSTTPIDSIDIAFSEPTKPGTFTLSTLTLQTVDWAAYDQATPPIPGTVIPLGAGVTITTTDDQVFHISGLASVAPGAGNYAITIDPSTVIDLDNDPFIGSLTYFYSNLPGNGVVGTAAAFKQSATTTNPHHILINSITEDPNNDGIVTTQTVTFNGQVWRPDEASFTPPDGSHIMLTITAFEKDSNGVTQKVGEIVWDTSQPGTPAFHQGDASQANYAFFQLPVTLLSTTSVPQDVTFQVIVSRNGTPGQATWLYWQDALTTTNLHTLTAHLTVDSVPPTINPLPPVTTPRTDPVSSIDVSFSETIDPSTFTLANLSLTRNGVVVPLGSDVTITPVNVQATGLHAAVAALGSVFRIAGLQSYTSTPGDYVLRVNGAGIRDTAGNTVANDQSTAFNVVPAVVGGPQVVGLVRYGYHNQQSMLVLTFNRDLNPTTAQDPNNYQIYSPGRDGRLGTADDVLVPIASGVYDPASRTVTLVTSTRLYLYGQQEIVVRGTGAGAITDLNGNPLDGNGTGQGGSNYVRTFISKDILAGPANSWQTALKTSHLVLQSFKPVKTHVVVPKKVAPVRPTVTPKSQTPKVVVNAKKKLHS